ncbi:PAS domain-containing sensor histidine kinase [Cupriavidus campinensis]
MSSEKMRERGAEARHRLAAIPGTLTEQSGRAEATVSLTLGCGLAAVALGAAALYLGAPALGAAALAAMLLAGGATLLTRRSIRRLRHDATDHLLQLARSESRLAGIIRSSMEAIITIDEQQHVVLFNPMAETLFGWPASEAIGRPLADFIPERYREAHAAHVRRFSVTGVSERQMGQQRMLYARRRDGVEFPIEASISQTLEDSGKLFTVMLRDTTERANAEAALRRSREEMQQLSENILAAREAERRRVARELHDDLGQRLSALKMDLVILEADLADAAIPTPVVKQVATMHGVIDDTVASVRQIAADLRPALLDELGIVAAIEWLAKDFGRRYGLEIQTDMPEEVPLGEQMATAVFRIVQEALSNVAHHAGANRVDIRLQHEGRDQVLVVGDDGRGWDGMPSGERRSFGLLGIRERARLMGGVAAFQYAPGEGFRLTVRFPVVAEHREATA